MPDNRYMPMNWVPRWNEAYYSTDSILRKLYFLSMIYYSEEMQRLITGNIVPNFYGEVFQINTGFIAKYNYPKNHIPHVNLVVSGVTREIIQKDTLGSFNYEMVNPVFCVVDDLLYFKNLEIVSTSVTSTSGYLSLTTAFSTNTLDTDSPIILENSYGDFTYIDQTSSLYSSASSFVFVPYNDTYTVYYRSSERLSALINETHYITIDSEVIPIKPIQLKNSWDEFAWLKNISRHHRQNNSALQKRAQHLTIAKKPNQRIASVLGTTQGFTWYASGSISASAYTDWEVQEYKRFFYFEEAPFKDSDNYVLTYQPTGFVQLLFNGVPVETTAYTITGSYIIPASSLLSQATEGSLVVKYKCERMAPRNTVDDVIATIPDRGTYRGILVKDVLVTTATKKIKKEEWRWNKELGKLNGQADFDF